ncbi:GNAT family N-acetyltransferase [Alkalihalobacillus sp. AL-G]|uniref:GNAT family N-acetyltransferase n=1 Tax=Alkalihalobacillus sp. AL-G TaxID=2926399 RepID=UPI00272CFE38|nr:GNAT family N-acetyltransferase [Alkalihalobacillus sp. AL-G]WLD94291.1 GNAT family N-acetyltransferase [Alkalihalobacillus sp. AL-G]
MIEEICTPEITNVIRKLLTQATSADKVNNVYQQYLKSTSKSLYSYVVDGEIVACIGIEIKSNNIAEILHIAVCASERGKHIGSAMIQAICNQYALKRVFAETDQDAVGFYEKCGFKIISLGEMYPGVERFN